MRRASPRAVTRVNPEQASKVRAVDADSALTRGRPPRDGEAPTDAIIAVHRGSGSSTWNGFLVQRGKPGRLTGRAVQRRVRRRVGRASERLVVPWKPRNGGGGKGPRFWNAAEGATGSEIGVKPVHSEWIPDLWWELYGRVKRDVRGRDARLRHSRGPGREFSRRAGCVMWSSQ